MDFIFVGEAYLMPVRKACSTLSTSMCCGHRCYLIPQDLYLHEETRLTIGFAVGIVALECSGSKRGGIVRTSLPSIAPLGLRSPYTVYGIP